MSIKNCEQLKDEFGLLKDYKTGFDEDFDKAIEKQKVSGLRILKQRILIGIDEIKKFFFDPEKIKEQLLSSVFMTERKRVLPGDLTVGSGDEWFDENVILKSETREVIFRGGWFEIEGFGAFVLPDNMTILSSAYIHVTDMTRLPKGLRIVGDLKLSANQIKELPDDIQVEGDLIIVKDKNLLKQAKKLAKKHQIWGRVQYIK